MDDLELFTLLYLYGETLADDDKAEWLRVSERFCQWYEAERAKGELQSKKEPT